MNETELKAYYDSMTPEEKFKAFMDMVYQLEMEEEIGFDINRIYWTNNGDSIGTGHYEE